MSFFRNKNQDAAPKNVMESAETSAPDEKRQASKLNVFQRGILQFLFSVVIASLFMYAGLIAFIQLYLAGLFSQNTIIIFFGLASALLIVAISFFIMKLTLGANLTTKITLPKIVEFSHALQNIGIRRFDEQIDFIAREKVFVFVSDETILSPYKENASVKRYIFLRDKEKLKYFNGDKRLCLDVDDYERLLEEHGAKTKSAFSARIAELEQNVTELKAVNSIQSADMATLTAKNKAIVDENTAFRQKLQTVPGREGRAEKRELDKVPFWCVAGPLVHRLIAEAREGTTYTRPQLQEAFEDELENFPELKPVIQKLLHTANKEKENTPFALKGWAMEAIRSALGDLAQKDPGATLKNKNY